jgi:hypothetical protein
MNAIPNRRSLLQDATEAPDPVFALIAAHKAAWAAFLELDEHSKRETWERRSRAADAAIDRLTDTPPTTLAGIRAAVEYILKCEGAFYDYLPTLLRSSILQSPLLAG